MHADAGQAALAHDGKRPWMIAVLLCALVFGTTAPSLSRLEFASGIENLVVATALEIRRTDRWLLPTLEGEPRVAKPPLAAWLAAAAIRPNTFAELDSPSPEVRAAAYQRLTWETRWPALLCACLMLLAVFDLGTTLAGARVGLLSLIVAASTLFFLRFGKQATPDVQLALWVAVANALLARLMFAGGGALTVGLAGLALGLAFMSKGPLVVVQSVLPLGLFWWYARPQFRPHLLWITAAIAVVVGGWWYLVVLLNTDGVLKLWASETTRVGARERRTGNPLSYFSLLPYVLPWSAFLVHGLVIAFRQRRERIVLLAMLLLTPIVIMSFFPDRQERYLLPMLAAAAVLIAISVTWTLDRHPQALPAWVHWVTLTIVALALPVAAMLGLVKTLEGGKWFSPAVSAGIAAALLALIAAAIALERRSQLVLPGVTFLCILGLQHVVIAGYRTAREGRSEMRPMAEMIRRDYPTAELYNWRPDGARKRLPPDLPIYANRPALWTADPQKLPLSSRPQLALTVHDQKQPAPDPPTGWRFYARVPRDDNFVSAFIREPQMGQ